MSPETKIFLSRFRFGQLARLLMLPLLFCGVFPLSSALQITNLYSHQVPVANESDAERDRAFGEALAAVILKVSGDRRYLQLPAIERALRDAQSYVEGISYSSELIPVIVETDALLGTDDEDELGQGAEPEATNDPLAAAEPEDAPATPEFLEQRYINVDFASSLIDELLARENIPVWDSNRPSVLVWMVLQDAAGERRFLTADSNPQIMDIMQEFAATRGLPIIFPLLDFEDRRSLSEDTIWALDQQAITMASERYGADSILAGRLHFTAGGELVGLWQFIFQQQADVFDGFDDELQSYLDTPLDRITTQLSSYFAIEPEAATEHTVRLRVDGIGDLTAYSALINYVRDLAVVENVNVAALDGDRLELQLDLLGDSRQLSELIDLDRDLLPIASSSSSDPLLHYRWTR